MIHPFRNRAIEPIGAAGKIAAEFNGARVSRHRDLPAGITPGDCEGRFDPHGDAGADQLWRACDPALRVKIAEEFTRRREDDVRDALLEAEDEPAENEPAENLPAENIQAENVPAENLPGENLQAENEPGVNLPAENLPAENVPAENVSVENGPAEPARRRSILGRPPMIAGRSMIAGRAIWRSWIEYRDRSLNRLHQRGMIE